MRRALLLLAALIAPCALALWGCVPAPTLELWYVAALANEERLLLAVIFSAGLGAGLHTWRRGPRFVGGCACVMALLGLVAVLTNEVRAILGARAISGPLSLELYLTGRFQRNGAPDEMCTFAVVEGRELKLDVWLPDGATALRGSRPAVIRVHGGSWAFGERGESPHWNRWLNERGFVVFDIDYRLTPPPRWRDATGDVKGAVLWVKHEAEHFGIDRERVVLMGTSAGAYLALLAAHAARDERFPSTPTLLGDDLRTDAIDATVAAVVAISPPVVLTIGFEANYPWWYPSDLRRTNRIEELLGGDPSTVPELFELASPLSHVVADSPPTFLAHGLSDELVWPANSERLAERLARFDVPVELMLLPATDHLFERRCGGWATQAVQLRLARFFDELALAAAR